MQQDIISISSAPSWVGFSCNLHTPVRKGWRGEPGFLLFSELLCLQAAGQSRSSKAALVFFPLLGSESLHTDFVGWLWELPAENVNPCRQVGIVVGLADPQRTGSSDTFVTVLCGHGSGDSTKPPCITSQKFLCCISLRKF